MEMAPKIKVVAHADFMSYKTSDGRKGTEPYVHHYTVTGEGLIDCDCGDCGTFTLAVGRVLKDLRLAPGYTIEYADGHGSLIKF